jgi:hypothetical protein
MFKAKTFSRAWVGKPGLIGSGLGNRANAFSLVRAGWLGQVKLGLTSGKAKTLPRASLALSFNPVWVSWVRGLIGLGQLGRVSPLSLNPDRVNFLFSKSFINLNNFDSNLNLNYE